MALRWLAAPILLTLPLAPVPPSDLPDSAPPIKPEFPTPVASPLTFDHSLDSLEQNRVITRQERLQIEAGGGGVARPIDVPAFQQACRTGALSKQECREGVAVPGRDRRRGARVVLNGRDGRFTGLGRRSADGRPLPPISVPVSALLAGSTGGFRLESVFAVSPRPAAIPGNGNRKPLFPILGSAITTSEFGWRMHPIVGQWLMHAGKDFAAPEGTPVVAALSGTVLSSGLAGGYGIAVELDHGDPPRRTLYGHLSEIYVKAGQTVRQGEVIGRVGSTGLSTGPHLHFELRRPDGDGWVATDPGDLDLNPLTASGADAVSLLVGQLMNSLERPEAP
ncbi:MAG: M23 family metallopeptidase, partial [Synechococcus sp. BS307-5m-G39]|nr:M23 family metallopeptidase [Synechococcus sp. BS307-5m-G39]